MNVTLGATSPCFACGYLFRMYRFSEVRVNKGSLRETAVSLVFAGLHRCPECGAPNVGELRPVSPWRLEPADAARVAAVRERRWPGCGTPGEFRLAAA